MTIGAGLVASMMALGPTAPAEPAPSLVNLHLDGAGRAFCTGVLLRGEVVLTAGHCASACQPAASCTARVHGTRAWEARALSVMHPPPPYRTDLALLRLAPPLDHAHAAHLARRPVAAPGAAVQVLVRDDRVNAATAVRLAGVLEVKGGLLYTTPATCDGDSGAPLLSMAGELIGVATERADQRCGQGSSIFVELVGQLDWLEAALAGP